MTERSPEAKARRAERARERYLEKDFEWHEQKRRYDRARGRATNKLARMYPDVFRVELRKAYRALEMEGKHRTYRAQNARGRALTAMGRLYPGDYSALMMKELTS